MTQLMLNLFTFLKDHQLTSY